MDIRSFEMYFSLNNKHCDEQLWDISMVNMQGVQFSNDSRGHLSIAPSNATSNQGSGSVAPRRRQRAAEEYVSKAKLITPLASIQPL